MSWQIGHGWPPPNTKQIDVLEHIRRMYTMPDEPREHAHAYALMVYEELYGYRPDNETIDRWAYRAQGLEYWYDINRRAQQAQNAALAQAYRTARMEEYRAAQMPNRAQRREAQRRLRRK